MVTTSQLFRGLVESGPAMEMVPDLARDWEVREGGRRYVFHLREDARWSDGVPLTASDFEFTWERVLDPVTGSPWRDSLLYDIAGAVAFCQGEAGQYMKFVLSDVGTPGGEGDWGGIIVFPPVDDQPACGYELPWAYWPMNAGNVVIHGYP
jgi:ABC-type transport system substrate-binding protein